MNKFLSQLLGYPGRESLVGSPRTGRPYRVFISSVSQLQKHIRQREHRNEPCYLSTHIFESLGRVAFLDRLYFDFDCAEHVEKAWTDARLVSETLTKFYKVRPLILFSGRKGFNVYAFLQEPLKVTDVKFFKNVQAAMYDCILKGLKVETFDSSIKSDIVRLSRIPHTIHERTGSMCVPVDEKRNPISISSLKQYYSEGLSPSFLKECIKEATKTATKQNRPFSFRTKYHSVRPCIEAALKQPLHNYQGNLMRIAVSREFLNAGEKEEHIACLFSDQEDYSFTKSLTKVKAVAKKRIPGVRCEKIRELGFCLGNKCSIFRRKKF